MGVPRQPRVLLLMTTSTYRAHAFMEAAARMDLPVVVGSERTQALAAGNPSGHLTLGFLDIEEDTRRIVELAGHQPVPAVIAADDDGAILAATAASRLGLRHASVEAVRVARDKFRMRQALVRGDVPSPRFRCLSLEDDPGDEATRVSYPCVLKPLFLSGSRGVIRADEPRPFVEAFGRIERILRIPEVAAIGGRLADRVLVEDYIPGAEVAVEGLLSDGTLRVLAIYDKPDPLDGPYFEESLMVTPSRHPDGLQVRIAERVQEAVAAVGLDHGPVHAELRIDDRDLWILEIAPRSIGGLCSRTLRFERGVSLEELILRHAIGQDVERIARDGAAAGVMMVPIPGRGILREVRGREDAEAVADVEEVRITIPPGGEVVPLPEGTRYLGFIFARAETPGRVEAALREAHRRLEFTIVPAAEGVPPR